MRDVVDVLIGALALGQVVGDSDITGDALFAVAKRGDDKLHRHVRSILADIRPLSLVDETLFRGKPKYVMIGIDFGVELRREIEGALPQLFLVVKVDAVAADEFALLIPEHLLCGRVDGGDDSRLIRHDDAEGRACDDGFVEVESALQVFLVLMTRGDVGDRRRDAIRQLDHLNLIASQARPLVGR